MLDNLLKNNARSLYLSAKILPAKIRPPFYCAYLLCRIADTIADTDIIPQKDRIDLIRAFPYIIDKQDPQQILKLKELIPQDSSTYINERVLMENISLCINAFNALSDYHKKITLDVVHSVCFGMEWDLSFFPSTESGLLKAMVTADDTERYCDYMGGQPGVFWAKLLLDGSDDEGFVAQADSIGKALQIVNILRDMPADIAIGRIYLPMSDITKNDLMPQDFLDKKNYKKVRPIIYKWINFGLDNIQVTPDFVEKIPFWRLPSRIAVTLPALWCLDTLLILAGAKNLLDPAKREKISRKTIYKTLLLSPFICINTYILRKIFNKKWQAVREITQ